ncbi:MAG: DUF1499 domain-containing protein [Litoreibacter sp.]|nr:DUF1499 domain-containing protein [Litoreibacter sp.]
MKLIVIAGLVLLGGLMGFVRLSPLDAARLEVDPEFVKTPSGAAHFLLRNDGDMAPPVFEMSAGELSARLEQVILSTPRTVRLSGRLEGGVAIYVSRSVLWGFPDIASVKVIETGHGRATFNILSRSRFGGYDWGMNEARVRGWLDRL